MFVALHAPVFPPTTLLWVCFSIVQALQLLAQACTEHRMLEQDDEPVVAPDELVDTLHGRLRMIVCLNEASALQSLSMCLIQV